MSVYYQDEAVTLLHGDALEQSQTLPAGSVDCIVTSPPYFGLRDYGSAGQYGLEETPAEYVETMRALFSELHGALADDGTLWLNLGDSYGKGKQLQGIPWRVALALQDDRWTLRNDVIWHKPNGMPQSVTDRLGGKHEHIFMFSKSEKYHFDLDAIREEHTCERLRGSGPRSKPGTGRNDAGAPTTSQRHPLGKNPGDVWSINTVAFTEAHFAVYPPDLVARCVKAGCKPGGTVLDPFSGSGTTGMVAQRLGRKYVGIDISAEYLKLSLETRLQNGVLDFAEGVTT